MFSSKAQINQIFVYILSIILIVFAGFLVAKFLFSFDEDLDEYTNQAFFDILKDEFSYVYQSVGSERTLELRVTPDIELVCFIDSSTNCLSSLALDTTLQQDINSLIDVEDNVFLINDVKQVMRSNSLTKDFIGCFCTNTTGNLINIKLENYRREIYINEK